MPLIQTADMDPAKLRPSDRLQAYCGLDTMVTLEVRQELGREHNQLPPIYQFERALQAPYLEIMLRGFAVDDLARRQAAAELRGRIEVLQGVLNEFALAVWGKGLNPRSPAQLKDFFYQKLRLPEVWLSQKGERKLSTNREALEKLEIYLHARPVIACILGIRDLSKQLEVFETEIDSDGRFRTSYNIAGTETGRPSSSSNAFGTGGNAQNIAQHLRWPFVADPGFKIGVIDLEQVEARDVGFFEGCLFDDWKFLDACESGDLHTNNSKLIWPELPWTGNSAQDRKIADRQFYREFSHRDMSKRGGHLCLTPDHEVLTPYGWVPISDKPLQIMSWSEKESYFTEVIDWTHERYLGELHSFEGNSISLKMTSNHRVPYKTDQRNKDKIKVKTAASGPGVHMPLGNGWVGGFLKVPARLIAAFMSDGYQKSVNRVEFHLKKERKITRLIELCKENDIEFRQTGDKIFLNVNGWPKRAGAFMFEWTKQCIEDFIDEYKYWDGHISKTAVALFSVDREHLEWIQTFGRITGTGGQIKHQHVKSDFSGTSKMYETDYYILGQNKRVWASGKSIEHTKNPAFGAVFCPTVSSGFFYVRRNGKICVTGNSNYMGTAWTASRHLKVPIKIMEDFQQRYCHGPDCAYPAHRQYWQWIAQQLQTTGEITTPFGRQRHFFGRPGDNTTLREAIAFVPQSTTADRMNLGLWRIWRYMPQVQLLAQTYDSVTFQYRETEDESGVITEALSRIRVELRSASGRSFVVPGEAKIGWNWGSQVTETARQEAIAKGKRPPRLNLDGLIKWKPQAPDKRKRQVGLQRIMI